MYDLLITNADLLTMEGVGVGYVRDGAVAINGRTIAATGPRSEVEERDRPAQTIDAQGGLVMPKLIDVHLHSASVVARRLAQEVATWMGSAYGPLVRHSRDEDAPLYTMLALMEGVAAGTTTFGDFDYPMNAILRSHIAMGSRAVVCQGVLEINWADREKWVEQGWKPGVAPPLSREYAEKGLREEMELSIAFKGGTKGVFASFSGRWRLTCFPSRCCVAPKRLPGSAAPRFIFTRLRMSGRTMPRWSDPGFARFPISTRLGCLQATRSVCTSA